jgi:hypothetical protein
MKTGRVRLIKTMQTRKEVLPPDQRPEELPVEHVALNQLLVGEGLHVTTPQPHPIGRGQEHLPGKRLPDPDATCPVGFPS